MTTEIITHEPVGAVRGTAIEIVPIAGKERRIAQAYLLTDATEQKKITVELPKSMTPADLRIAAERLIAFVDALEAT